MTPAAHALLDGLFDYAGLFPPAGLDLARATERYARYRSDPDAWMLGRFLVPVGRLADEDEALSESVRNGEPWRLSVLGTAPEADASWLEAALEALATARAFEARQPGRVLCDRFEVRLPAALAVDPDALVESLLALDDAFRQGAGTGPRAALEVPFLSHPDATAATAQAVAEVQARVDRPAFAVKLRCGGLTPDVVPSVEQLASALVEVIRAGVPFKATAGLHHPLPAWDEAVGARMHGFLGVFGGSILARLHGLDADALAEILDSDDPDAWSIDDELAWARLGARPAEVADGRRQLALGFGTCSFDEPRDDLRRLGWLSS